MQERNLPMTSALTWLILTSETKAGKPCDMLASWPVREISVEPPYCSQEAWPNPTKDATKIYVLNRAIRDRIPETTALKWSAAALTGISKDRYRDLAGPHAPYCPPW
jgi:hypothetical protein